MNVFIIHAIEEKAGSHWQQWLHDELVKLGVNVVMPGFPDSNHPDRKTWLEFTKEQMSKLKSSETIIVGHSLGVTVALDYLEQAEESVLGLISVAGFDRAYGMELNDYFLREKDIDLARVIENVENISVIFGDNDPYVPQEVLKVLAEYLSVKPEVVKNGGHINTSAGYEKLPQVLEIIKEWSN